jgi:uncharacterized protein (TIGR02453 family)
MAETTAIAPRFEGFPPEAFSWFAGLEAPNSRAYFTAHRDVYDRSVRDPFEAMLEELADELGGHVKLFRQNRDVRFSADKSPYKTTTYGLIIDRPESRPSLYAQVSARGLFAGTGYHQLAPDQLTRFRQAIVDDGAGAALEEAITATHAAGVETYGEALKTAPRGYPRDHPRAALLRHKSLVAGRRLDEDACVPLNAWLDEHVGASEAPAGRYGQAALGAASPPAIGWQVARPRRRAEEDVRGERTWGTCQLPATCSAARPSSSSS